MRQNVFLAYTERPVELIEPLKETRVPEHSKATLSCKLSKPNKKVTWFKNGVELSPTESPRYSIVNEDCEYTITLDDCSLDDTAKYSMRCQDIETSATLTIDGTSRGKGKIPVTHSGETVAIIRLHFLAPVFGADFFVPSTPRMKISGAKNKRG